MSAEIARDDGAMGAGAQEMESALACTHVALKIDRTIGRSDQVPAECGDLIGILRLLALIGAHAFELCVVQTDVDSKLQLQLSTLENMTWHLAILKHPFMQHSQQPPSPTPQSPRQPTLGTWPTAPSPCRPMSSSCPSRPFRAQRSRPPA